MAAGSHASVRRVAGVLRARGYGGCLMASEALDYTETLAALQGLFGRRVTVEVSALSGSHGLAAVFSGALAHAEADTVYAPGYEGPSVPTTWFFELDDPADAAFYLHEASFIASQWERPGRLVIHDDDAEIAA
jgi:hypothetical protein